MVKYREEKWHGQELFTKIGISSVMVLEICLIFIMDILNREPIIGTFVIFGICFYFMGLAYASKSFAHKITLEFAGKRRWRTRYDLGRGRTGNATFYIHNMYPLNKAPKVLREQVAQAEAIMYDTEQRIKALSEKGITIENLSLLFSEDEIKSKKEKAIKELREKDITEKIGKEYILDKILQPYYEKETKNKALIKGKPTKDFIDWKNSDGKVIQILEKAIKTQILQIDKDKKVAQKEKKERRLQLIGEQIALRSSLGEIISADNREPEGGAVHAFLKNYFKDYKELINKEQILDIAQGIAKEIWIPPIAKVINKIELDSSVKTVVELYEGAIFDHDPHLPFQRMVVYAQEPLEDAVDWKESVPKTIHYYSDIPVTNGYSNIIVPTRITHDTPMVVIAHSPGKDYFIRNLEMDKEEIEKKKQETIDDTIADLEGKLIDTESKANAHEVKEKTYRKIAGRTIKELEIVHTSLAEEKLKRYSERKGFGKTNIGKALLYLAVVVIIIIVIVFLVGASTTPTMTNSTQPLLSFIFSFLKSSHIGWWC